MAPPIVFNKPESMLKMRLVTLRDQSETALKTLHELGALEVEESAELTSEDMAAVEADRDKVRQSLRRVEGLLAYVDKSQTVELTRNVEDAYARPIDETHAEIELVYSKLERIYEKTNKLRDELKSLVELQRYLVPVAQQLDLHLRDLNYGGDYLYANVYAFAASSIESFQNQTVGYIFNTTVVPMGEEAVVYAVAKAEFRKKVDSIADGLGGKALAVPSEDISLKLYIADLDAKVPKIEVELAELTSELQENVRDNLPELALLKTVLAAEDERLGILEMAYQAKYVNIVEGWVPEVDTKETVAQIEKGISDVYVETRKPSKSEDPPSKLKNVKGVKPFEVIVNLFSVPKYDGWDPTPIVAYFFAAFFGLMFADVVYGVALLLSARFVLHKLVDDPTSEGFKLFRRVLYIGGAVGLILGLFAGNWLGDIYLRPFGYEGSMALIAGVRTWLGKPINFLELSLWMGLLHVNIAHAIGLYRGIKQRNKAVILGKLGLFAFQIAAIPIITSSILKSGRLPAPPDWFLWMALIGVIAIIVAAIMERGGFGGIFWLFDVTGVVGDTMSYARLAGVGLAGFYLASAFNQVAQLLPEIIPWAVVAYILMVPVLIAAHLINLFLGVLSGFVHSLRLCFVEFLMKFYEGGGREYAPFKLKRPKSVIVGEKT